MNKLAAAIPADLVIRNAGSGKYELSDAAVYSGKIAGIAKGCGGKIIFDAEGRVLIIDWHIHISGQHNHIASKNLSSRRRNHE